MSVSVIIPCYNQGCFLADAIESLLMQSFGDIEIVVVNDGSSDDTDFVAKRFGKKIKYISQENRGLSAARNTGINASAGRFVMFLDADDLLHSQSIRWLVDLVAGSENKIAMMGYRFFEKDPLEDFEFDYLPRNDLMALPTLLHCNIAPVHCSLTPRARAVAVGGFDERLLACEDWDFWRKLAFDGAKLVVSPNVGAFYRVGSTMSTDSSRMENGITNVICNLNEQIIQREDIRADWGIPQLNISYARLKYCLRHDGITKTLKRLYQTTSHLEESLDPAACQEVTKRHADVHVRYSWRFARSGIFGIACDAFRRSRLPSNCMAFAKYASRDCKTTVSRIVAAPFRKRVVPSADTSDARLRGFETAPIGVGYEGVRRAARD